MVMHLVSKMISLSTVLILASGCNATNFSSGLAEEKPVDTLTAEEQVLYCDSLNEFVSDSDVTETVRSIACRSLGLAAMFGGLNSEDAASLGTESSSCEEVYDLCMAATDLEGFDAPQFPCTEGEWESCDITVGELEACISEITQLLGETDDLLSCNLLGMASEASASTFEDIAQVQSCITVVSSCSDFVPALDTDIGGADESGAN